MEDSPIPVLDSVWHDDLQLAQLALTNPRAEDEIFRRVYPRIFKIARFVLGDRGQIDDVAQLAAIQVLKSLKSFKGRGSLESWAGQIAYRTAMRSLKKKVNSNVTHFSLSDADLPHQETPEAAVSRRQQFEMIATKMDCIPAKRRVPLLLHLAYGYTIGEVSELTDASKNTVKARLKVGFRELRKILRENPNLLAPILEDIS